MNRFFEIHSSAGAVTVVWDSRGLITGLAIRNCTCSGSIRQDDRLPRNLQPFFERLQKYLQQGEPLGPIPWDLLDASEITDFQKKVYQAIQDIPHGETRTYSWVAARLGKPAACRAVGQALRNNPFPVLIPCHRVVSVHDLGGFMGSTDPREPELRIKQRLIDLESSYVSPFFSFLTQGLFSSGPLQPAVGAVG